MNCPQCYRPYTAFNPSILIPYCQDTICSQCLQKMYEKQGVIWCIHHPPQSLRTQENQQTFLLQSNVVFEKQNNQQTSNTSLFKIQNQFLDYQDNNNLSHHKKNSHKIFHIENLPINQEVMHKAVEYCFQHSQHKNLFCLNDGCHICSNCALFGNHKGHDVILISQVSNKQQEIKKRIKKLSNYLHGNVYYKQNQKSQNNIKSNINNFLQSLKSENISRNQDIAKWLNKNIAKLTHKIQKQYQQIIQNLTKQKDSLLHETILKLQQFSNQMKNISYNKLQQYQTIQRKFQQLNKKNNPFQYLYFNFNHHIEEQLENMKQFLVHDLKLKTSQFDKQIDSFQINKSCIFTGNIQIKRLIVQYSNFVTEQNSQVLNQSENSIQLYQLLNGVQQDQDIQLNKKKLTCPQLSSKQLKKMKLKTQRNNQKVNNQEQLKKYYFRVDKSYCKETPKQNHSFTRDSIQDNLQKCTTLRKNKFSNNYQESRLLSKDQKYCHSRSERNLLKGAKKDVNNTSVFKSQAQKQQSPTKKILNKINQIKRSYTIFQDTIKFYKYPETSQYKVTLSIKRIQADQINLDNFKAIEIVKKIISNKGIIKYINFANNKLSSKFLQFIANNSQLSKLKYVNLKGNKIKKYEVSRFLQKLHQLGVKVELQ